MKIVSFYFLSGFAVIITSISRAVESIAIKLAGMKRICWHIVNVLFIIESGHPAPAVVF
jgi:hypothetical protein